MDRLTEVRKRMESEARLLRAYVTEGECKALARTTVDDEVRARIAARLAADGDVEILNDVVLNQVLVRFGDDDERTAAVVARVQAEGTCWLGGTTWRGRAAMRISVSSWKTSEADVDRSVQAILAVASAA